MASVKLHAKKEGKHFTTCTHADGYASEMTLYDLSQAPTSVFLKIYCTEESPVESD